MGFIDSSQPWNLYGWINFILNYLLQFLDFTCVLRMIVLSLQRLWSSGMWKSYRWDWLRWFVSSLINSYLFFACYSNPFENLFHLHCLDKQEQEAPGQSCCTWCLGQTGRVCAFTLTFLRCAIKVCDQFTKLKPKPNRESSYSLIHTLDV